MAVFAASGLVRHTVATPVSTVIHKIIDNDPIREGDVAILGPVVTDTKIAQQITRWPTRRQPDLWTTKPHPLNRPRALHGRSDPLPGSYGQWRSKDASSTINRNPLRFQFYTYLHVQTGPNSIGIIQ
ncbi:hypothetical protein L1049_027812 [Liquidambar formosana]|uniref:Uncharacterized protein n=1 Tax=Liquidambar formosana TaxID=63359 RepID=A0AAP0RHZ3_LIQFO